MSKIRKPAGLPMLPDDAVHVRELRNVIGGRGHSFYYVGDFVSVGGLMVPTKLYFYRKGSVRVSLNRLESSSYLNPLSSGRVPSQVRDIIIERFGLLTPKVRRAWVVGRMLRDQYGEIAGHVREWEELTGLASRDWTDAVRVLDIIGLAVVFQPSLAILVRGPEVTPLELAALE